MSPAAVSAMSWCVTSTLVVPSSMPQMQLSRRCLPTCASTADSGSSSSTTSAPA